MSQAPPDPTADSSAKPRINKVEAYFDDTAQDWSELYGKAKRVNDLVLADRKNVAIEQLTARIPADSYVLDAGCGAGLASADLLAAGHRILGVDISTKMLDHAKQNFDERGFDSERYELTNTDIIAAGLPAETFEGIIALGFLQYQDDEGMALTELKRILKPGGAIVITGPTNRRIANWLGMAKYYHALRRRLRFKKPKGNFTEEEIQAAREQQASRQLLNEISTHTYDLTRFDKLLTDAGFKVEHKRGHGYVNYAIIGGWIGYRGELFLHKFFTSVSKVLPIGRWANDVILVATKPK